MNSLKLHMIQRLPLALLLTGICLALSPATARAWDGERQGLLLGIGVGAGAYSYSGVQHDLIGPGEKTESGMALAISPKIGYAINNQWALLYSRHPFLFSATDDAGKEHDMTSCIESVEVLYFLDERAPSLYLGLGAGVGYFFDDSVSNYSSEALKGVGLVGTVGYEPFKHVTAELSLHLKSPQSGATDLGVSLIVSVLGY